MMRLTQQHWIQLIQQKMSGMMCLKGSVNMTPEELEGKSVFLWTESKESGKRQDLPGGMAAAGREWSVFCACMTVLWKTRLDRVRFMIPNLSYPLDDRYEVHIMIRDGDTGYKLMTDNLLYDRSTGV